MPRILKNQAIDDELSGISLIDLKKEYKKLKSKYDKIYGGFYCHSCDQFLPPDNFYVSTKWKSGVVPTCKKCLEKIALGYNEKTKKTNETEESIKEALQLANLPFLRKEYNGAVSTFTDTANSTRRTSVFQQYMGVVQSLPQYRDMRWEDGDFEAGEVEEEKEVKLSKDKKKRAVSRFGSGFTDAEYGYLEDEYQDWISRYECNTKAQEEVFENLSLIKLLKKKAMLSGESTKDLDKQQQDWLDTGKLKPKQNVGNSNMDSLSFGQLIEKWEEEEPIPEPDPEFKDVNSIGKLIRVYFSGHLAKALGLNVPVAKEYEEEMSKYTVTKTDKPEEQTSSEIYNQVFGVSE